ncbi:MAG TPA: hypothetical protein VN924_06070 [Bryobacteraceae bacterium]|nr:hypothetical protein [Bryobacteraceae bacterium]
MTEVPYEFQRDMVRDLMIDHNVGVAPIPRKSYALKRLDEDYFESLDL